MARESEALGGGVNGTVGEMPGVIGTSWEIVSPNWGLILVLSCGSALVSIGVGEAVGTAHCEGLGCPRATGVSPGEGPGC